MMHLVRYAAAAFFVGVVSASAWAADVRVPQDFKNLKDALIAAQPGDRVIVSGGRWRNGRILKPDVTLTGRMGATLSGGWEIGGSGATVEGFIVRDGLLTVTAGGVTLRGNRFLAPRFETVVYADQVTGLTFENNRCTRTHMRMRDGTNHVVRGNRLFRAGIDMSGDGVVVEDNAFRADSGVSIGGGANPVVRRNDGGSLYVSGANALVEENTPDSLEVRGAFALVAHNEIRSGSWFVVLGDDAIVRDNRVHCVYSDGGLVVNGERALVTDNVVDNLEARRANVSYGFLVRVIGGASAHVVRNQVSHAKHGGMLIESDGAEVAWNTLNGTSASISMRLEADGIDAHDNTLVRKAEIGDQWSGIVVDGDDNSLTDMSLNGAPYDGVLVQGGGNVLTRVHVGRAGRCGITIDEISTGAVVAECTVERARWAALFVLGTDTTVTGGTFGGGRKVDVLDLGTGTKFESATFATKSEDEALRPFR